MRQSRLASKHSTMAKLITVAGLCDIIDNTAGKDVTDIQCHVRITMDSRCIPCIYRYAETEEVCGETLAEP